MGGVEVYGATMLLWFTEAHMAELVVDEKNRVAFPRDIRKGLGIASGSKLEVVRREDEIIIRPVVSIKEPTEALRRLARRAAGRDPKRLARS